MWQKQNKLCEDYFPAYWQNLAYCLISSPASVSNKFQPKNCLSCSVVMIFIYMIFSALPCSGHLPQHPNSSTFSPPLDVSSLLEQFQESLDSRIFNCSFKRITFSIFPCILLPSFINALSPYFWFFSLNYAFLCHFSVSRLKFCCKNLLYFNWRFFAFSTAFGGSQSKKVGLTILTHFLDKDSIKRIHSP